MLNWAGNKKGIWSVQNSADVTICKGLPSEMAPERWADEQNWNILCVKQ